MNKEIPKITKPKYENGLLFYTKITTSHKGDYIMTKGRCVFSQVVGWEDTGTIISRDVDSKEFPVATINTMYQGSFNCIGKSEEFDDIYSKFSDSVRYGIDYATR